MTDDTTTTHAGCHDAIQQLLAQLQQAQETIRSLNAAIRQHEGKCAEYARLDECIRDRPREFCELLMDVHPEYRRFIFLPAEREGAQSVH
jgi:hypothetical protein